MRLTTITNRVDRGGKHNDRNFDLSNSSHIDPERTADNRYYTYNGDYTKSFRDIELEFYEQHFDAHLEEQRIRNEKARHGERNKTINQYYRHDFTRPEDCILQIGNIHSHVSPEQLWECAMEYVAKFDDRFGEHCKILDMALHVDEATPHVHIRRVWISHDKDGHECVSQTRALKDFGLESTRTSKYDNEKMMFSKLDRQLFLEICQENGIEVNVENQERRKQYSITEYKEAMQAIEEMKLEEEIMRERIAEATSELEQLEEEKEEVASDFDKLSQEILENLATNQYLYDKRYDEIKAAEKEKDAATRFRMLMKIFTEEILTLSTKQTIKDFEDQVMSDKREQENNRMKGFIKSQHMEKKYKQYLDERYSQDR